MLKNQISSLQKQLSDSKEVTNGVNVLKAATSNIILNGQSAPSQLQLIQNKQFVAIASPSPVHQQQMLQFQAETQKQHQQQQQQHSNNKIVPIFLTLDDPNAISKLRSNEFLLQQLMSAVNGSAGSSIANSGIVGLAPQILATNNISTISLGDIENATKSSRPTNV